jgi:hypothetical protein
MRACGPIGVVFEMRNDPHMKRAVTLDAFRASARADATPPAELSGALLALWYDAQGDWARAHECAQEDPSRDGSWVHGYLHRKEGDLSNASSWYEQAGRPMPGESPATEWEAITRELLGRNED